MLTHVLLGIKLSSLILQVLIALRFYACGSYQQCVADSMLTCVSQPSVSRAIKGVTRAINVAMLNNWVYFPNNDKELQLNKRRLVKLLVVNVPVHRKCFIG